MSRLPMLMKAQLNEAQLRLHDNLTGGERAKAPRKFPLENEDGSLNGPFNVLHVSIRRSATWFRSWGTKLRFASELSDGQLREVAIITVSAALALQLRMVRAQPDCAQKEGVSDGRH